MLAITLAAEIYLSCVDAAVPTAVEELPAAAPADAAGDEDAGGLRSAEGEAAAAAAGPGDTMAAAAGCANGAAGAMDSSEAEELEAAFAG